MVIECVEIIAAADVLVVDEDLGDGTPTVGAFCHFDPRCSITVDFVFGERYAFPAQ